MQDKNLALFLFQSFSLSFITATYEETPFPYFQRQIISSLFELALSYFSTVCSSLPNTKSKLKDCILRYIQTQWLIAPTIK
ncbi:hypothetical protein EI989_01075 [Streptococcus suis]|nr:hypothetical protein EI985_01230 [Streptococcus suis]RRR42128.1 hypothetical protein EI989_01075 [Streptococcus suis]RRR64543.1 hypothetical protein EI991_01140 [Streptococcus suis]